VRHPLNLTLLGIGPLAARIPVGCVLLGVPLGAASSFGWHCAVVEILLTVKGQADELVKIYE